MIVNTNKQTLLLYVTYISFDLKINLTIDTSFHYTQAVELNLKIIIKVVFSIVSNLHIRLETVMFVNCVRNKNLRRITDFKNVCFY